MLSLAPALTRLWPRRGRPPLPKVPKGLDVDEFLRLARLSFVRLQAAWDEADLPTLERLTTGPLLADLREQLEARGTGINHTDVLQLQARLLAFEDLGDAFVASVEFTGLIREGAGAGATDFRELWMLTRLKLPAQASDQDHGKPQGSAQARPPSGEAWQLARMQALA